MKKIFMLLALLVSASTWAESANSASELNTSISGLYRGEVLSFFGRHLEDCAVLVQVEAAAQFNFPTCGVRAQDQNKEQLNPLFVTFNCTHLPSRTGSEGKATVIQDQDRPSYLSFQGSRLITAKIVGPRFLVDMLPTYRTILCRNLKKAETVSK